MSSVSSSTLVSTNIDMDVRGYVNAERKSNSPLEDVYSEQIANAQEAIRLAKKINPDIKSKIEIINYIENDTLVCAKVRDMATGFTGIQNMQSKEMFKLFHHSSGENTGFSEYGIGGKLKNMLLARKITYNTKTNSGPNEKSIWDVDKSIEKNSIIDAIEYFRGNSDFQLDTGYYTGTELICENITEPYRTQEVAESIMDLSYNAESDDVSECQFKADGLYKRLCKKYIKIDETCPIYFIVYKDGQLIANKKIVPSTDLANYKETIVLHIYESMATKKLRILYEKEGAWYESEPSNEKDVFRKDASILKPDKIASIQSNYIFRSNITVFCSTDSRNINNKMGYDTYRIVDGGYIIKTNPEKLRLKWSKWSSHRTRYAAFRGAIMYDRNSDIYLNSDKAKTTSDDRPFHDLVRWNILHITDKYFAKMKTENGFYDTAFIQRNSFIVSPEKPRTPTLVPISGVLSKPVKRSIVSNVDKSTDLATYSQPLAHLDEYDTREKLIELLCVLHNKPGDKKLAHTFDKLANSESALKYAIEDMRAKC
jgi:hypothetical protein